MRPRWLDPAIVVVYAVLVGLMLSRHAMWRDEMQAWLIVRDAPDLGALFRNLRYEGHPALWYLLLWPLGRISRDPVMMQVLHLVIASASVALVLWRAPLLIWERVLFPFGYFFIYEYAVKSRSYALGCLFLFLLCAIWRRRHAQPLLLALVLALMANVHILFAILAIAALLALAAERFFDKSTGHESVPRDLLSAAVALGGIVLASLTCIPPSDSGYAVGWVFKWNATRLMQMPDELNVVLIQGSSLLTTCSVIAIFVLEASRWRLNPAAAIFLFAGTAGLLIFFYVKYPGSIWHHGLIFAILFAAVWISRDTWSTADRKRKGALLPPAVFVVILLCQVYTGFGVLKDDWKIPLSSGRNAAAFISARGWAADPLVVVPDEFATPIIGYLGIDRAYYPNGGRWGSFNVWDRTRLGPVDLDRTVGDVAPVTMPMVWIVGADVDQQMGPALRTRGFVPEATFTGARSGENYVLYRREPR